MRIRIKILTYLTVFLFLSTLASAEGAATSGASNPHIAKAMQLRSQAGSAYDAGDYDAAALLAKQAKNELALVGGRSAATKATLPASYTVRLIPSDRDCLSKIAGYSFVYGDRNRWTELFKANKATLKHPENEDLILPGEVLVIPSIAGEARDGAWSLGGEYPEFKHIP